MNIGQIIRDNQPDIYKELEKRYKISKSRVDTDEKINHRDIEELMSTRSYRRGKGGAIKQVK